jgi:hypothetical protein
MARVAMKKSLSFSLSVRVNQLLCNIKKFQLRFMEVGGSDMTFLSISSTSSRHEYSKQPFPFSLLTPLSKRRL